MEKLRGAASTAFDCLYEEEGSALARLAVAEKSLEELARYDSSAGAYLEPLAAARVSLKTLPSICAVISESSKLTRNVWKKWKTAWR